MSWARTWSHDFLLALDLWCAAVFFGVRGITISTLAVLVRDGQDALLNLRPWQKGFLQWLEPRLSRAHCDAAKAGDIAGAKLALKLMGVESSPSVMP